MVEPGFLDESLGEMPTCPLNLRSNWRTVMLHSNKSYPGQLQYFIKTNNPNLNDNQNVVMAKSFVADIANAVKEVAVCLDLSIDDQVFSDLPWSGN